MQYFLEIALCDCDIRVIFSSKFGREKWRLIFSVTYTSLYSLWIILMKDNAILEFMRFKKVIISIKVVVDKIVFQYYNQMPTMHQHYNKLNRCETGTMSIVSIYNIQHSG